MLWINKERSIPIGMLLSLLSSYTAQGLLGLSQSVKKVKINLLAGSSYACRPWEKMNCFFPWTRRFRFSYYGISSKLNSLNWSIWLAIIAMMVLASSLLKMKWDSSLISSSSVVQIRLIRFRTPSPVSGTTPN
jgi:hypothetical protein